MKKQKKICSVKGCSEKVVARGYCNKHYSRWKRHGFTELPKKEKVINICKLEGCNRKVKAYGYCQRHWIQEKNKRAKNGDLSIRYCSVEGCNKPHVANGYCSKHYLQTKVHGKIKERETPQRKLVCSVEWCNDSCVAKNLCMKHYDQMDKHGRILEPDEEKHINRTVLKYPTDATCKVQDCFCKPVASGFCMRHYDQFQKTNRKIEGNCIQCGKELDTFEKVKCEECSMDTNNRYHETIQKRTEQGLCVHCNEPATIFGERINGGKGQRQPMCEKHYFMRVARARTKSSKNWKMIKQLFEDQKGLCAYTGRKLVLGKNASLDHTIPETKGGGHTKDNLQWVLWEINMMKRALDESEFIEFCIDIADRFNKGIIRCA